jgi:acyl CoA:acetate/3-ketoacid CoA transferase beta subunit
MNYTRQELMIFAAAKEIKNNQIIFVGTGLPMLAGYLAKATHAPDCTLLFEAGIIDPKPRHLAVGVGDFRLMTGAVAVKGLYYALGLLQSGHVDLGFLGAGEIDRYGNVNTTVIGGTYKKPKLRLPGSGGANDIASLAKNTVIIVPHTKRKLVEMITYLTTPGYLTGKGAREEAGLRGKGPKRIITDLAILGFNPDTSEVQVESIHDGVSQEDIRMNTGFDISYSSDFQITVPPTSDEVQLIRSLDPDGVYLKKNE